PEGVELPFRELVRAHRDVDLLGAREAGVPAVLDRLPGEDRQGIQPRAPEQVLRSLGRERAMPRERLRETSERWSSNHGAGLVPNSWQPLRGCCPQAAAGQLRPAPAWRPPQGTTAPPR